jgi:hypothetical protein
VWGIYLYSRKPVEERLAWLRNHLRARGVPSVFTDAEHYAFVAGLVKAGRVVAMVADLTGTRALRGLGEALRELELPLRTLFLSNAEQYFDYVPAFRDNILGLSGDDQTLVLRTRSLGNGRYEYYQQTAPNFAAFLRDPGIAKVQDLFRRRSSTGNPLLFRIAARPTDPTVRIPKGFRQ